MLNIEHKIIAREISQILWKEEVTLSTAESCTSGLVAAAITSTPGSSYYFVGGVVSYSDHLKNKLLGVPSELIAEKGAVSQEVSRAMVEGALDRLESTYAMSVTGYAGPGATTDAAVGTIWISVGRKDDIETVMLSEDHGRDKNVQNAALVALQLLLNKLKKDFPQSEE